MSPIQKSARANILAALTEGPKSWEELLCVPNGAKTFTTRRSHNACAISYLADEKKIRSATSAEWAELLKPFHTETITLTNKCIDAMEACDWARVNELSDDLMHRTAPANFYFLTERKDQ
jgi:hypothetical protein